MNPELTREIAERLAARQALQSQAEQPALPVTPGSTVLTHTADIAEGTVTVKAGEHDLFTLKSLAAGGLKHGELSILSATSGAGHSVFDGSAEMIETATSVAQLSSIMPHNGPAFMPQVNLDAKMAFMDLEASLDMDLVRATLNEPREVSPIEPQQSLHEEVDDAFWQALGIKGPEDLTPDNMAEISKKLASFQRQIRHSQKHFPTTMGKTVHVKSRTPKHRKKKR